MRSSFVFSHQKCVHSGFSWMRCHSITCGQTISIGFLCCFRKSCFVAILSSRDKTLSWSTPWKKWRKSEETKSIQPMCCCPHWAATPSVLLRRVSFLSSAAKETYLQGHGEVRKIRGFLRAKIKVTNFFHALLGVCHWVTALVQTRLRCVYARAGARRHEVQFLAKCGCLPQLSEAREKFRGSSGVSGTAWALLALAQSRLRCLCTRAGGRGRAERVTSHTRCNTCQAFEGSPWLWYSSVVKQSIKNTKTWVLILLLAGG